MKKKEINRSDYLTIDLKKRNIILTHNWAFLFFPFFLSEGSSDQWVPRTAEPRSARRRNCATGGGLGLRLSQLPGIQQTLCKTKSY
ncbi:hypothetical protein CEXT_203721 [Caerostris extrusa]|uniref:Uncharacterized protein n=1 Tax=Caerostris extrusa TaxID=172846 RepID=A0AAV4PUQ6_CAEEX|nr:hypothetical protein CEXT_203721 [Caerostris extrusa]